MTKLKENIVKKAIETEVKNNKLNYAYSINLYRSFPNVLDGMKVVSRRIMNAADQLKLANNKPHQKSIKLISSTMVFHNHGDASIYDAIAKLTQDFYIKTPLLDGQGSWGNASGDSQAAPRYCVTGETLVVTENGLIEMKDLVKDSKENSDNDLDITVASKNNNLFKANKFFNCGTHPIYSIKTELGYTIDCTGNHPLIVLENNNDDLKLVWKLAEEIENGDIIVFNGNRHFANKDHVTINEARFLGGMVSEDKEIPKLILQSTKDIQREFLKYLYEGDGCVDISKRYQDDKEEVDGKISFKTCSKKLAYQVQQVLLNSFNILSSVSLDSTRNGEDYQVVIESKYDVIKFKDQIGFVYNEKQNKLSELINIKNQKDDYTSITDKGYFIHGMTEFISKNKIKKSIDEDTSRSLNSKDKLIDNLNLLEEGLSPEAFQLIKEIVDNDYYFLKVKSNERKKDDVVYSIRVNSDCHSFIANGMINHNTEIRLSKYGEECIEDLHKNTVNWVPSALGDDVEPVTLPVKYPNLLINGSYGIGQGFNSFIPTHNFNEIIDITIDLIKDPSIEQEKIINRIAPDFPLGGIIINREELKDVYRKGYGVCKVRGEVVQDVKNNSLIIKSFPHIRTNLNSIKDNIADKIKDGYLQGISDMKDLTKKNNISLVIKAKRGYSLDKLEQELYKLTPLQSTLSLSFMCTENDNYFRYYQIKEIFIKWIDYRKLTIKRALNYDMTAVRKRLHIIEALLKALIDIDTVITTIKKSENKENAIENLMKIKKYDFNILQARYIVELQLSSLTKIGKPKLLEEQKQLNEKLDELISLFTSDKKLSKYIIKELEAGKKKYGQPRKTKLENIDENDVPVIDKDYTLFLTKQGYVKKMDLSLNVQSSGTKGRNCGKLKKDDYILSASNINNKDTLIFFTNKGLGYAVKAHEIDEVGLSVLGILVKSMIEFKYDDEEIVNVISVSSKHFKDENAYLIFVTANGLIKKTKIKHYEKINKSGLISIKLNEGDYVQEVLIGSGDDEVIVASNTGKYNRFTLEEVPESLRMTLGVISMGGLNDNEIIISATLVSNKDYILCIDKKGLAKRIAEDEVIMSSRTNKGKLLTKTDTHLVKIKEVDEDDELTIVSKEKILKIPVKQVKQAIRTSKGKPCIDIGKDDIILDIIVE